PALRRDKSFAGVVAGRLEVGAVVIAWRWIGNLHSRRFWGEPAPGDYRQGTRCFSGVESQDWVSTGLRQRADVFAAGLHYGSRWHESAAHDRPGLRGFAGMGAEWTVSCPGVGTEVRSWRAWFPRHLPDGHCQQAMGTAYP